jgi:methanethiol S-methyltransferase
MKAILMFAYSIIAYLVGFVSLLFWILSVSNLIPAISIDRNPEMSFSLALAKNFGLVLLFAIPHSVMARKFFKDWITLILPRPIERSTYVLQAGLLLSLLVWQWEPLGGNIWRIAADCSLFYVMYFLFFLGWAILFISSFLINHFDLFGLRQTYLELKKKPYQPLDFKIITFYKYVRHPLYFGGILGLWATPVMTMTHLVFAILLTAYFIIGAMLEEKDLSNEFGEQYLAYKKKTPMLIPFFKKIKSYFLLLLFPITLCQGQRTASKPQPVPATNIISYQMDQTKNFNTPKVFRTNLVFPQAVITGNLIFVSGTAGIDPSSGKLISDNFEEQAIQAFKNCKTILEEAGSGLGKVVKTTIYMVSGYDSDFKIINKVYSDFFPNNPPARSAPQVMPFPGGILISIECIAHL